MWFRIVEGKIRRRAVVLTIVYPGYQRFFSRAAEIFGVSRIYVFARVIIKTWQKPETTLEKSLALMITIVGGGHQTFRVNHWRWNGMALWGGRNPWAGIAHIELISSSFFENTWEDVLDCYKTIIESERKDLSVAATWDQVEKEGEGGSWGSRGKVWSPTAIVCLQHSVLKLTSTKAPRNMPVTPVIMLEPKIPRQIETMSFISLE